ncbi:hypothetical protein [uncultured Leifsonia sp.]|uniref:hypothetical protein n=1 Tax=uncultured Leifsonia sp. TaxID=340359 RepID=UPI0028D541B4|nr:hypothetical protein [uncultured Leifsonia sp.]
MDAVTALPGMDIPGENRSEIGGYGQGPTERETRQAIAEIEELSPLTGARRTLKQLAISLAISIDKGNAKGRAIANEAGQLFEMMNHLSPAGDDGDDPDDSKLTSETKALLTTYAAPARPSPTP